MTTAIRGLRAAALFSTIAFMAARPAAAQMPDMRMGAPDRHLFRVGFGGRVSVPTSDVRDAREAFVEGRLQNICTDAGAVDARSIRAIPVSFGILF